MNFLLATHIAYRGQFHRSFCISEGFVSNLVVFFLNERDDLNLNDTF